MSDETDDRREWHDSLTRGYERRDIRMRWIVGFLIILIVSAVVIHTGVWFLLKGLVHGERSVDRPQSVLNESDAGAPLNVAPPDAPSLQPTQRHDRTPPEDLAAMRGQEDQVLAAMGWTIDPTTHRPVVPASLAAVVASRQSTSRPSTTQASSTAGEAPHAH
jgi:hypothetical protein